eukprot:176597-Pleurochrysis_carterae.AAC.3
MQSIRVWCTSSAFEGDAGSCMHNKKCKNSDDVQHDSDVRATSKIVVYVRLARCVSAVVLLKTSKPQIP